MLGSNGAGVVADGAFEAGAVVGKRSPVDGIRGRVGAGDGDVVFQPLEGHGRATIESHRERGWRTFIGGLALRLRGDRRGNAGGQRGRDVQIVNAMMGVLAAGAGANGKSTGHGGVVRKRQVLVDLKPTVGNVDETAAGHLDFDILELAGDKVGLGKLGRGDHDPAAFHIDRRRFAVAVVNSLRMVTNMG